MDLNDYRGLPETLSAEEVARLLKLFIQEQSSDTRADQFEKLEIISDKQWHTYDEQPVEIKELIESWIAANWESRDEFLELAMGLIYSFGLPKSLFKKAFDCYGGSQRKEFQEMIDNSAGKDIDPYWSLRHG